MRIPARITLLIDRDPTGVVGEKQPLPTPKSFLWRYLGKTHCIAIDRVYRRLRTGDYAIAGFEHVALVEKKSGISELAHNFSSTDSARANRALTRLRDECAVPVLLVTGDFQDVFRPSRYVENPEFIFDSLARLCYRTGVHLLWFPRGSTDASAELCGAALVRFLWSIIVEHETCPETRRPPHARSGGAPRAAPPDAPTGAALPERGAPSDPAGDSPLAGGPDPRR